MKEIATLKPANFYNSRLATNLANMALAKAEGKDEFDFQFGQRGEHPDGDEIDRNEEGI